MKRLILALTMCFLFVVGLRAEVTKHSAYHCQFDLKDGVTIDFADDTRQLLYIRDAATGRSAYALCLYMQQGADPDVSYSFTVDGLFAYDSVLVAALYGEQGYRVVDSENSFLSCSNRKVYAAGDRRLYSVSMFAREHAYIFLSADETMLDEVVDGFYSSRRFCIQNYLTYSRQRIMTVCGFPEWVKYLLVFVNIMLLFVWCTGLGYAFFIWALDHESPFAVVIWMLILLNLFCYLCLHDYYMDWLYGFGSFWALLFNFFSMFSAD